MKRSERSVFLFILLVLSSFWTGCSSEEIKKSENTLRIRVLYDSLDHLKKNYEAKNTADFFSDYSTHYPNLDLLKKNVKEVFDQYPQISLQFYLDHIVLEPASSSLVLRWEGEWTPSGEAKVKTAGHSIFKYSNASPPLLIDIQGMDPFASPPIKDRHS
ncbi:MAG: hypothetical protein HY200_02395 [Nitrospirae bacterium]|nr:hypothetical protein [Nitrospirota bacterium]MBI3593785.1 hypothetical protein [Nitrospirota bacterium]